MLFSIIHFDKANTKYFFYQEYKEGKNANGFRQSWRFKVIIEKGFHRKLGQFQYINKFLSKSSFYSETLGSKGNENIYIWL